MSAGLDQFAKRLGIGIDVLENLVARRAPGPEPAIERANIGITQGRKPLRGRSRFVPVPLQKVIIVFGMRGF